MNPERCGQIEQGYQSALEVEPGRREAFLKEASAGDESLFEEVALLLAQKRGWEGCLNRVQMKQLPEILTLKGGAPCGIRVSISEGLHVPSA